MRGLRREDVVAVEIETSAERAEVEAHAAGADAGPPVAEGAITTAHGVHSDAARCGLSMKLFGQ